MVDGFHSLTERFEGIADEVQQYLAAKHRERHIDEDYVRPDMDVPSEMPEPLLELVRMERWAELGIPPMSGGWMQYPYYWTLDIEAAMVGRRRFEDLVATNRENKRRWRESQSDG